MPPRTIVYIDGFNLYYGIRHTGCRWLDVEKLIRRFLPSIQLVGIKYFTANVSTQPNDPDKPNRQQMYLRALKTIPNLEIIYGQFYCHVVRMPLAKPQPGQPRTVEVIKTEEKGSDVNLATHLLHDGHKGRYDMAAVVSNDSDLLTPIRLVIRDLRKKVGVINPQFAQDKKPSFHLSRYASFFKTITESDLRQSLFPERMRDAVGEFHKPVVW